MRFATAPVWSVSLILRSTINDPIIVCKSYARRQKIRYNIGWLKAKTQLSAKRLCLYDSTALNFNTNCATLTMNSSFKKIISLGSLYSLGSISQGALFVLLFPIYTSFLSPYDFGVYWADVLLRLAC